MLILMIVATLSGCFRALVFIEPGDPDLPAKLGITTADWAAVQELCAERTGYVIKDVAKFSRNLLEVEFNESGDTSGDQGGPFDLYEKKSRGVAQDPRFSRLLGGRRCWPKEVNDSGAPDEGWRCAVGLRSVASLEGYASESACDPSHFAWPVFIRQFP